MTAATVTKYIETANPNIEVAQLTCTDGETYYTRKFNYIQAVLVSGNQDNDAHINAVVTNSATAGSYVTINYAGMTDQLVTVVLFGQ